MTSAQVVETLVTNDSSFQNYPHPDNHTIIYELKSIKFYSAMHCTVVTWESFWLNFDIFLTTFGQLYTGFYLNWPIKKWEQLRAEMFDCQIQL